MRPKLAGLLGDDPDRAWNWFAKHDAYCGVLGPEYRMACLTPERKQAFFETGAAHVDRVLGTIARRLGEHRNESCLDFGCGVGRLVIPFAHRFQRVTGVDISAAMLDEARKNCGDFGVQNVALARTLDEVRDRFDLVHSYIVLQHIPISRGAVIIDKLIDSIAPGGACFIHFTIGRNRGFLRNLATDLRKNVKPVHWMLNIIEGQAVTQAYMQSNRYNLNSLAAHLYDRGIREMWLETENHAGPYSVCIAFRVGTR